MAANGNSNGVVSIPVISATQPIGQVFAGVIKATDLIELSKVDRIRLENLDLPSYAGYQRALDQVRVSGIRSYITTPDSTFPNSIIVNCDSEYIENWNEVNGSDRVSTLDVRREEGAFTIIDGQHRTAALDIAPGSFEVLLSIFVDLEMVQAASVFSKINSTQKPVNPSIAFQLFGYSKDRSPQRTVHEIAKTLHETQGSPFYQKLRMLGTKDGYNERTLSQSTFAKRLMSLYTRNYTDDEYRLLRSEKLPFYERHPFRHWFIEQEDAQILRTYWRFFTHVAQTWEDEWFDESGRSILPKTTGYSGFVELLRFWLLSNRSNEILNDTAVESVLLDLKTRLPSFVTTDYPPGQSGVILLRDRLLAETGIPRS